MTSARSLSRPLALALALVTIAACTTSPAPSGSAPTQASTITPPATTETAANTDAGANPARAAATRVATATGAITETVFALGQGARVVAIDATSTLWPPEAAQLPNFGFYRAIAPEGLLATDPALLLAPADAGPPPAIEALRNAGVDVRILDAGNTVQGTLERITAVADALGVPENGTALRSRVERELAEVRAAINASPVADRRVLVLYARGTGTLLAAGTGTAGDEMLREVGAINAAAAFEGFRPLTPEAAAAGAPDVIVLPAHGFEAFGGVDAVLRIPGVAQTPAGRNRAIVTVDDALLFGFGPRVAQGLAALHNAIRNDP